MLAMTEQTRSTAPTIAKNCNNNKIKNDNNLSESGNTVEHVMDTQPSSILFDETGNESSKSSNSKNDFIIRFISNYSVLIGLLIRFFCAWCFPYLMDSSPVTGTSTSGSISSNSSSGGGVMYTDIDYYV